MVAWVWVLAAAARPAAGANPEGATPQVLATTPTLGQWNVPADLDRIVVQWDRPMSTRSWSWCGGGYSYPQVNERPFFVDEYTAVLPVTLEPQHTYSIGINCASARNFRSADGVAAEPLQLQFVTAAAAGTFPTADARNYESWAIFRELFFTRYSYLERTGTDWQALFAAAEQAILEAPTPQEWAMRAAMVLRPADDPHLYLRMPDGQRVSTHAGRGTLKWNREEIERAFAPIEKHGDKLFWGRREAIGYLCIAAWSLSEEEEAAAHAALADLATTTTALILDVRPNGGGDEPQALRIAAWFLDEPVLYARHRWRDPEATTGWGPVRNRWARPNEDARRYAGRIFVLQGSACLSSNEAFLLAMRRAPRATSLGERTGGSSGNPRSYDLPNGVKAALPGWQSMTPDGEGFEGVGLAPDIEIDGDFRTGDPVLRRAMELAEESTGD